MTTLRRIPWARLALLAAVVLLVAACVAPTGSGSGHPVPTPIPPLKPAPLDPNPFAVLSWLYTPVFQALFLLLVAIDRVTPDMGIAIIVMTLIVRTAMVPLMRRQMVSMRQMQAIQPELKEIQRRYKADRVKQQQAISELYKDRGVSQAGCLVGMLPLLLLIPMYTVIREGLQNPDPTAMLQVFGVKIFSLACNANSLKPCLDTSIPWLGGVDASQPSTVSVFGFAISALAVVYVVISLAASRMALPAHDPTTPLDQSARTQRTMALWLPLIFLVSGNSIPVGLFLYLLVSTIYQIVQQYLTTGWGGMFPIFGWTPAFAVGHTPRFPVAVPSATRPSSSREPGAPARPTPERSALDRSASAASTIRQRGRQGRRGRRR